MTNFKALAFLSILLIAQTTGRTLSNLLSSASASTDGSSTSINQKVSFLAYTAKYGKSYSSTTEFQARFNNWLATDNYIKSFNNSQVVLQHNKFSDWSQQEKSAVLNSKLSVAPSANSQASQILDTKGKKLAVTTCPYGQFLDAIAGICKSCPPSCQSCLNSTLCYACSTSNFALKNNVCVCATGPLNAAGNDCGTCLSSQFLDLPSNSCKNCNQNNINCNACTQQNVCTSCKNGWTLSNTATCQCVNSSNTTTAAVDANGYCVQCRSNQVFNGGQCQNCPQYCNSCTVQTGAGNATFCTQCAPGFILSRGGCACPINQVLINGQCVNQVVCPQGQFAQANNTCAPCQAFCSRCAPLTGQCLACIDPSFRIVNATDSSLCLTCQPLFSNVQQGQCRCAPGFALSPTRNSCLKIDSCPRGFYYSTAPNQFNCQPCSTVTNDPNQNLCAACNAFTGFCNQTVDPTVLINQTTGIPYCPQETFLQNGRCIGLIQCPSDHYNDGQNNCLNCSSNCLTCANRTGFCTQCADTYSLDPATKTCKCLITQFIDIGTNNYTGRCVNLTKCPAGQYNNGWNNCSLCVQNCTSCMDISGQCNQCANSFYQKGNSCICNPDPTKQFFNTTTGLCTDIDITLCPDGQYNKGDNTCGNCPANCTTCDILTGYCNQCQTDRYTFYQPKGQAPYCACAYGKYWNKDQNDCYDCNTDILSLSSSLALPNYGNCTACHLNINSNISRVQVTCDVCPPNLQLMSDFGTNYTYCGCINGFYVESTTQSCQKCQWANCQKCSQAGGCLQCEATFSLFYINGATTGPQYCDCDFDNVYGLGKQILVNGQCQYIQDCGDNYYTDLKTNQCASCPFAECKTCENEYNAGYHTCTSCFDDPFTGLPRVLSNDKKSCNRCKDNEYWHNEYKQCYSCSDEIDGFGDKCATCGYDTTNKIYRCNSCTSDVYKAPVVTAASGATPATATKCLESVCNGVTHYTDSTEGSKCAKCPGNLKLTSGGTTSADCKICPDNKNPADSGAAESTWTRKNDNCICQMFKCSDGSSDNKTDCLLNDATRTWEPVDTTNNPKSYVIDLTTQECSQFFAWQVCPDGYYNPGDNNCTRCKANCTKCNDYTGVCTVCSNGQMDLFDNNTCGCKLGKYATSLFTGDNTYSKNAQPYPAQGVWGNQPNGTLGACFACPQNCTRCSDNTGICLECIPGYSIQRASNGQVSCICEQQNTYLPSKDIFYGGVKYQGAGVCLRYDFCKAGQWASYNESIGAMVCQPCGDKCASCDLANGNCKQCINNDYSIINSWSGKTAAQPGYCYCPDGKYNFNNTCQSCAQNCSKCDYDTGKCNTCNPSTPAFTLSTDGKCTCTDDNKAFVNGQCEVWKSDCGTGKYNDGANNCPVCPDVNAVTCEDITGRTLTCRTNMQYNANNWTCTCPWINGRKQFLYYNSSNPLDTNNNYCTECSKNCTACMDGSGNCTSCVATYTLNVPTSGVCQCNPDPQNNTAAQIGGLAPGGDGTECAPWVNCGYSRWNPGDNQCRNCSQYAVNCSDWFGVTTKCYDQSMYLDIWANNSATNFGTNPYSYGVCGCTQNQYLGLDLVCRQCAPNCINCSAGTGACITCAAGFIRQPNGTCGCNRNQFLLNGVCAPIASCAAGSYNPGNNACVPCPDKNAAVCAILTGKSLSCKANLNFTMSAAGVCTCAAGSFFNATTNGCQLCSKFCTSCQDLTGRCLTCNAAYTLQANYTCACMANQYAFQSTSQCNPKTSCPAGKYNLGNNACQNCPTGCSSCTDIWGTCTACSKSSDTLVDGQCQSACPTGRYNPGNNVCTACPTQNCVACSPGSGSCTRCVVGYTLDPNTGVCGCNSNQYLIRGVCQTRLVCPFGQYNRGDNTCAFCPANCSTCAAITGACTLCKGWGVLNYTTGQCFCPKGYIMINGVCSISYKCNNLALPFKQYNVGNNTCQDCRLVTPNCDSCADFTGTCTKCVNGGIGVVAWYLTSQNQCAKCSDKDSNCIKCSDITGYCTTCQSGFTPNIQTGACDVAGVRRLSPTMDNCAYSVGPVNNATICLSKPASDSRVVPEFKKTEQSVDWRKWNVVGSVKDQGSCASDFAFSSTGAAESAYAIKTGKLFDLSEQFLVDCDTQSFGCSGGYPTTSSALLSTQGAVQESDYPYTGKQNKCQSQNSQSVFKLQYPGSQQIGQSKDSFKEALRQGPISVNFGVSDDTFWYYSKGILPAQLCKKGKLNHAMLAVGYGVEGNVEYALIQNTFGTGWGEDGLIRVELTNDSYGPCGLYAQSAKSLV